MKEIIIRKETEKDYKASELMTMRAFWNIHGAGCNEHYLLHIIRKSSDYLPELSRIAEVDGKIVGGIFYTKAKVIGKDKVYNIVTFGPLAVDPMYHSLGIGKKLFIKTAELVKQAGYKGICIFGEPDYYPKLGFKTCDNFGITDMQGNNFDAFMGYEVIPDGFCDIKGKFCESPDFEESNNIEAVNLYEKQFPKYPKYKVPSQWLHEQKLGKISSVSNDIYEIEFWEQKLQAVIKDTYKGQKPKAGDLVTFDYIPSGKCLIRTKEDILK